MLAIGTRRIDLAPRRSRSAVKLWIVHRCLRTGPDRSMMGIRGGAGMGRRPAEQEELS